MRKLLVMAGILAVAAPGLAAAAETRRLEAKPFTAVAASAGVRVELEAGRPASLALEGDAREFDRIRVSISNGVLEVTRKPGWFPQGRRSVVVHAATPRLRSLEASSGALIAARNLAGEDVRAESSSGGLVRAEGACGGLTVDVSSGGVIEAEGLNCVSVLVDASSGGVARVHAREQAVAEASSGGLVTIVGSPRQVSRESSSGGRIEVSR